MSCGLMLAQEIVHDLTETVHRQAMPLLVGVMSDTDKKLEQVAQILAKNLERSGQFIITVKNFKVPAKQSELGHLFDKNFPLTIFLEHADGDTAIAWRLYDVPDQRLVKGRKYVKRGTNLHGFADNITDELWPVLTSQASSFSSKLAYVKKKKMVDKKRKDRSVVCIANSDGSDEQILIPQLGTYVALYWHHDKYNPCLFCSEFTRYNVRLISANLQGKKQTVLNLKGTCVGISLAPESDKVVYCRSGTIWQYSYDKKNQLGTHTPLIANEGKNCSPTLLANGDIIFCSDSSKVRKGAKTWGPKICYYKAHDGSVAVLTDSGYCVSPNYCAQSNKVAYSKKVEGVMQLCVYDMTRKKETQLTFDSGNKIDCCWSPCGNFIVYCYQKGPLSRIAVIHVAMKKVTFITPAHESCSCPAWSPVFDKVPVMQVRNG